MQDLFLFGERQDALKVARSTLRMAEKYFEHNVAAEICRKLSKDYSLFNYDEEKRESYYEKAIYHVEQNNLVMRAERAFSLAQGHFTLTKSFTDEKKNALVIANRAIAKMLNEAKSPRFFMYYYFLRYSERKIHFDYKSSIQILKDAITYYGTLAFNHSGAKLIFIDRLIECYIQTGQYELAKQHVRLAKKNATSHNERNRIDEYQTLLAIHKGDYKKALHTVDNQLNKNSSRSGPDEYFLRYEILELYILLCLGKTENVNIKKIESFLDGYVRDKQSLNTLLLIAKLWYYAIMDVLHIKEIRNGCRKYLSRYILSDNGLKATEVMIKYFLNLPERVANGSLENKSRKTIELLAGMKNDPKAWYSDEEEVVPFGDIVQLVADRLVN